MDQIAEQKTLLDRAMDYYRGERVSNAILMLAGFAGLFWTFSIYWWRHGHLSTGMYYSALPLSIFLILSGGYRFVRSFRRYNRVMAGGEAYLDNEMTEILAARASRFRRKRTLDTWGIVLSMTMIFIGLLASWHHVTIGTAISILICSFVLLAYDLFGQFRTEELLHHLSKKNEQAPL